jgi:hypothetical protein
MQRASETKHWTLIVKINTLCRSPLTNTVAIPTPIVDIAQHWTPEDGRSTHDKFAGALKPTPKCSVLKAEP